MSNKLRALAVGIPRWCDHLSSARVSVSEIDGRSCVAADLLPSISSVTEVWLQSRSYQDCTTCLELGPSASSAVCVPSTCFLPPPHATVSTPVYHTTSILYNMDLHLFGFLSVAARKLNWMEIQWSFAASSLFSSLKNTHDARSWSLNHV